MENPTQRVTSASKTGVARPAGVPNSAFQLGDVAAGKPLKRVVQPVDPDKVTIIKNRPLPEAFRGDFAVQARNKLLLDRMQPGDSCDLSERHAKSCAAYAKKNKIKIAVRKLAADVYGVWRL